MTRKEQNKILDDKIESNANQYNGDLNKCEFLTRKDLKYKPNALDKVRFEFSPLGKTFNTGLDKTVQGYQEEGVIKLLKDIRDSLAGGKIPSNRPNNDDGDDGDDGDEVMMAKIKRAKKKNMLICLIWKLKKMQQKE